MPIAMPLTKALCATPTSSLPCSPPDPGGSEEALVELTTQAAAALRRVDADEMDIRLAQA